jgi:RES domain-containing protein
LSPALAVLEVLAHMEASQPPKDYVIIPLEVPEAAPRQVIDAAGLPNDWQRPGSECCKELGDAWYDASRTLLLDVPSAVMPLERNIVVNPNHPKFKDVDTSHAGYPLRFDPRLLALLDQKSLNNS